MSTNSNVPAKNPPLQTPFRQEVLCINCGKPMTFLTKFLEAIVIECETPGCYLSGHRYLYDPHKNVGLLLS